jgi:hypothetical protein
MANLTAAICPQCGAPVQPGARSCTYCYVAFTQPAAGAAGPMPASELADLPPLSEDWTAYTNAWVGCSLAHPPRWKVVCSQGVVNVREGNAGLVSATLQAVQLQAPVSAADFSQQWINSMRATAPGLAVFPDDPANADPVQVSLRVQAQYLGASLLGHYTLSVRGQEAFISGYQCPPERAASLEPVFQTILSSYRPVEKMARQIHQEASENAFSVWIPSGWQAKSGVNRSSPGGAPMLSLDVTRDSSSLVRAAVPWITWLFQEGKSGFWNMPGQPGQAQNRAYVPAAQFCQELVVPWMHPYHQQLQMEEVIDRPDLLPYMTNEFSKAGANPQMLDLSAAMLVTTYVENRAPMRQVSRVLVQHPRRAILFANAILGGTLWSAYLDSFYRAPQAEFEEMEPVLAGVIDSMVVNPAWQQSQMMGSSFMMGQQNNNFWPG